MSRLNTKHLKPAAMLAVLLIMAFGLLGTALAASQPQASQAKQGLFGTVSAKAQDSFTLDPAQGNSVTLKVTADTKYQVPGKAAVSFADISVGARVAVLAQVSGSSGTALSVMSLPSEPQKEHRTLTVIDISGKTVTAEDAQGNKITVTLNQEPSADLKGQIVTFIGEKSAQSNQFKANVEVKIGNVVDRLQANIQKADADAKSESNADARAKKEQQLSQLRATLEANMKKHLDSFNEVIAKAPEQAKAALQSALDASMKTYQKKLEETGQASADAAARLKVRTIEGTVDSVDATAKTVTISSGKDAKVTVKATSDTKIQLGDRAGALADVAVGSQVTVRYNPDTMAAASIAVKTRAQAEGRVQSIDAVKNQIVFALNNGATLTLNLSAQTQIKLNGKDATVADIKVNMIVVADYDIRTMNAIGIKANTLAQVSGVIGSVDLLGGSITVQTRDSKAFKIGVPAATQIKIQGLKSGLAALKSGATVAVTYDLTTLKAVSIEVRAQGQLGVRGGPQGGGAGVGTIASVNAANGEVALKLLNGESITLTANANTDIQSNGAKAALADLKAGDIVRVAYNVDTKVASSIAVMGRGAASGLPGQPGQGGPGQPGTGVRPGFAGQGTEVNATIKSLDAANHKMVLQLSGSSTLELILNADTVIRLTGQQSKETDLKVGMEVQVGYNADTKVALRINSPGQLGNTANGTIDSVDTANHKVVIVQRDNSKLTLIINSNTLIQINGQTGKESDLKQGMTVLAQYAADTRVAARIIVGNIPGNNAGDRQGAPSTGSPVPTRPGGNSGGR